MIAHHSNNEIHFEDYDYRKRLCDIGSVIIACLLFLLDGFILLTYLIQCASFYQSFLCILGSMILADFLSGITHWIADTWGSTDIPIIGEHFLKPFRDHHVDPTSITRHDYIKTNCHNYMATIPIMLILLWILCTEDPNKIPSQLNFILFVFLLGVFISHTNQIHKWSHTYYDLPRLVVLLQKYHVILPQKHHRYHHIAPHDTYYCITTGWLNYPLEYINFWGGMEKIITKLTGLKPRSEDEKWSTIKKQRQLMKTKTKN